MKKPIILILSLLLIFAFVSCGSEAPIDTEIGRPPAFSILQKQTQLTKHSEKGETATFSQEEFFELLGETPDQITVNSLPEATEGRLIYNGLAVSKDQTIPVSSINYLKFIPNGDCESASFTFTCNGADFENREMICELVFSENVNLQPLVFDCDLETVAGIPCGGKLSITEPNGDDYTINVITYPRNGFIKVNSDGSYIYSPEEGFSGGDSMVFTVTDRFGKVSDRATLSINVEENENAIYFADMQNDMNHLYAHKMCRNNVMVYKYENGSYYFDPDAPVSKLDFLVMLMTVTGQDSDITAVADSAATDDNGLSSGLKGYLSAANEKGLIKLENGVFSPKQDITVASAAYMVASALKLPEINSESVSAGNSDRTFASILATVNAGIFETGEPSHVLTKSETAKILCMVEAYMTDNNMNAD